MFLVYYKGFYVFTTYLFPYHIFMNNFLKLAPSYQVVEGSQADDTSAQVLIFKSHLALLLIKS